MRRVAMITFVFDKGSSCSFNLIHNGYSVVKWRLHGGHLNLNAK
jgi:hypothetical protein